jgi:hypothetical protein
MRKFPVIIEMRTYKIKPGLRAEFLKILESKALPEHKKIGMKILGPFLSVEDNNTFLDARVSRFEKPGAHEGRILRRKTLERRTRT